MMRKLKYNDIEFEYQIGDKFVLVRNKSKGLRILVNKEKCPKSSYYACDCCGFQFYSGTKEAHENDDYRIRLRNRITPFHIKKLIDYHLNK